MFRMNDFHVVEGMTWDEAVRIIKGRGNGNLLDGMYAMNDYWNRYVADQNAYYNGEKDEMIYGDDDDFFEHWCYECTAYNIVFEGMGQLFGEAA